MAFFMRFILYFVLLRWFFNTILRAQQDPIEHMFISIEADLQEAFDRIDMLDERLDQLGESGDKSGDKMSKGVTKSKSAFELMVNIVQKLLTIVLDLASALSKAFDTDAPKDFQEQIVNLKEQIQGIVDDLKDTGDAADDAGKKGGKSVSLLGFAFGLAAGAAQKLLDIALKVAVAIPQFFAALGQQAIAANAQFETFAVQFETLLGSAGAAQDRLEELARFGVETPFELPEVVEASRTLQVFGGTALATGENLRLIGDIAAGVNQPFQSVAFWIGRMYDALQNGQPFGEAALRLQEMGALSGDTRREMEQMQKAGEDGSAIFAVFSEQVGGKFAGNMERLSKTFQGVTSNLTDFRENLLRVGGEPFFDEIRESAIAFLGVLDENQDIIIEIARGVGEISASVLEFAQINLEGTFNVRGILERIQAFVDWLNRTIRAAEALITQGRRFGEAFAALIQIVALLTTTLNPLFLMFKALGEWILPNLDKALIAGAQVLAISAAGWKGLLATLSPIGEVITKIALAIQALASGDFQRAGELAKEALERVQDGLIDVDAGIEAMSESILQSASEIDRLVNPIEDVGDALDDTKDRADDLADSLDDSGDAIAGMLDSLTNQMIDAVERRNEQLAQLEQDHAEKVLDIMADANKKRLEIEEDFAGDLAKLASDTEKRRLAIIADTREQLAKLAVDTDKELARRRHEFNPDELRETEDHLREMRRLEEDFLLNLEDAVRERDARAIVDLERRFQLESQRKEEDFQTDQSRGQEDFNAELDQIRENESERRQEILDAQSKELEDLRIHEEEKRIELETRRREDLEKLQENLNERLTKENQNYLDRQMALDQALQKQLEAIAKNLADEKEVTEEGAREILEIFADYFGIGGEIDQLMEQFATRRRIRADIQVEFSGPTSAPAPIIGGPGAGGNMAGLVPVPTFQHGGQMVATKPTLAMFGEAGPELATFTPLSELSNQGHGAPQKLEIEFSGSAPPGIGPGERDMIASTLLSALRDSGALAEG